MHTSIANIADIRSPEEDEILINIDDDVIFRKMHI